MSCPNKDILVPSVSTDDRLLAALCQNFEVVFTVNLDTRDVRNIRDSGLIDALPIKQNKDLLYEQATDLFVNSVVSHDDQERMKAALSITGLKARLQESQTFIERFRVERNGQYTSYYLKASLSQNADGTHNAVVGFSRENTYSYASGYQTTDASTAIQNQSRKTVLVVEDSQINREVLAAIIGDTYDIIEAENGKEGLQKLMENCGILSAVILDVYMPICDGFEFLQVSQADEMLAQIPVIVATASNKPEDEMRCLELGASDFVTKPYNPRLIMARLRSIIRLRESINTLSAIETDSLTGSFTRQAFFLRARNLMNHYDHGFVLTAARVEHYRSISTALGRAEGNQILKYLAKQLKESHESALVCRYEADCFLLLTHSNPGPTREDLDQLIARISADSPVANITVKYGVYGNVDKSLPVEDICDRAMNALRATESTAGRTVSFFDGPASQRMLKEQLMEKSFPDALRNREFHVWYQLKYASSTEAPEGAEALVRWVDQSGSIVPPGDFVPLFEGDGLIVELDEFVFRTVCETQKNRIQKGLNVIPISVNLSRKSLSNPSVADIYTTIAKENGVPLDLVPLELTESVAVHGGMLKDRLVALAEAGFPIHLDDFGSGYSSFDSLCNLPLDTLKIDKKLLDNFHSENGKVLLKFICGLSRVLKLKVVAEGVEEREQVDFLKETKCDYIQGYYFSKPTPLAGFEELLDQ